MITTLTQMSRETWEGASVLAGPVGIGRNLVLARCLHLQAKPPLIAPSVADVFLFRTEIYDHAANRQDLDERLESLMPRVRGSLGRISKHLNSLSLWKTPNASARAVPPRDAHQAGQWVRLLGPIRLGDRML